MMARQQHNTSVNDLPRNPQSEELRDYQLGIEPYVKGLVNFLKGTVTPMTVALQGEWGSGKTSLMYKLKDELCDASDALYDAVWINTWEYSLMADSAQALLKIVAKMVTATESNGFNVSKARGILSNLAKGVAKTALGVGTNDTSIIDAVTDIFTSGGESSIGQLQAELKKNIEYRFAHSDKRGIIFFIDDLDRLNPAVAVELLELLKNIFTIDGCIFVLAIDYDVVVKGLKGKYGELTDKNEREFRSFFDKIIQVPFAMPVSNYKPEGFIVSALESIDYINDSDARDKRFMEHILWTTKMTVGNNPRAIKRLTNILSLIRCITYATANNDKRMFGLDKRLGKFVNFVVLSIQVQYPKVFRMLSLEPDFTSWNPRIVKKMNCAPLSEEKRELLKESKESDEVWEQSLYAVCEPDAYLSGRFLDISNLLNRLRDEIEYRTELEAYGNKDAERISLGDVMRESIQMTSVTSFSADDSAPVIVDGQAWTEMVYKYHDSMVAAIQQGNPGWNFRKRRNTGNGGFNFFEPINSELPFYQTTIDNVPAMVYGITSGYWFFPQSEEKQYEESDRLEIINRSEISEAMKSLDKFMALLSDKNEWIEWESIYDYHKDSANFSRDQIVHSPKVVFKFSDIQRFLDSDNIRLMAKVIEELVKYEAKIDAALQEEFRTLQVGREWQMSKLSVVQ